MLTKRKIFPAIPVLIIVLVVFNLIPLFFKSDKEAYRFVSTWGSEGSQPGQFSGPIGIAIDSASFIYVSDGSKHWSNRPMRRSLSLAKRLKRNPINPTNPPLTRLSSKSFTYFQQKGDSHAESASWSEATIPIFRGQA